MLLTTNHAASSYSRPVLVDDRGNAYGPADPLPGVNHAANAGEFVTLMLAHGFDRELGGLDLAMRFSYGFGLPAKP